MNYSSDGTEAGGNGGALSLSLGNYQINITNSHFFRNQALGKGSAIYILEGSSNVFQNCSFYENYENNETQTHSIDIVGGYNQFQNCQFENNSSLISTSQSATPQSNSIAIVGGIENKFENTECNDYWFPKIQNNSQNTFCITCEFFSVCFFFSYYYYFIIIFFLSSKFQIK